MKLSRSQGIGILVLAVCFVCTILEVCDTWDPPIQSGNDTEYALVIAALCVGVTHLFVRAILRFQFQRFIGRTVLDFGLFRALISTRFLDYSCTDTSPPAVPLRI